MSENSPYLGLRPFLEREKDKFFGRQHEIHILTDKILAHRLTLLVAASGVGKSSLLQAGVMPALRASGMADLIYHNDWAVSPAESLKKSIVQHFIDQQRVNVDYQADFKLPLVEFLQIHALLGSGTMVILLDQFEEFFYYQKFSQQRNEFIRQLATAIHDTDTPTAFVFSMREDFAMEMEAFKLWYAGIFNNIYRIEKLELDAARLAIVEPVKAVGFAYQADLIELLLKDLGQRERSERLDLQHLDEQSLTTPMVEPPHLQIVCQQLWLKASASAEREITLEHYKQLGTATGILKRYFDDKMTKLNGEQQRLASKAFDLLVSQHGAKMSYPLSELASLLNEETDALQQCLDTLQSAAILRRIQRQGKPWYELYHDIFAKSIVEWNQVYKRRQLKKKLIVRGSAAVLAGAAVFVAFDGWQNYHQRHFRLGKETVSEQVEVYQGQFDSWDLFKQRHFLFETDYQRWDIEADKRFTVLPIAELNDSRALQIGQLKLEQRFLNYANAGLFSKADAVAKAMQTSKNDELIKSLIKQLANIHVQKSIDLLMQLAADKPALKADVTAPLALMNVQASTSKLQGLVALKELKQIFSYEYGRQYGDEAREKVLDKLPIKTLAPMLIALATDNDFGQRIPVFFALRDLGVKAAIPPLMGRLVANDISSYERTWLAQTLETLQPNSTVPKLLTLLTSTNNNRVRSSAIESLGQANAKEAIPKLIALLSDPDSNLRSGAITALGDLQAAQAIPKLMILLADNNFRSSAITALGKLQAKQAIPKLMVFLSDTSNSDVRSNAATALAQLRAREAIPALITLLADSHENVRSSAADALRKLQAKEAIPKLIELLANPNIETRWTAISVLGQLQAEAAIPKLIQSLDNSDSFVRSDAASALGQLKAENAISKLIVLSTDYIANDSALAALANLKVTEAIPKIIATNSYDKSWILEQLGAEIGNEPELAKLKPNIPKLIAQLTSNYDYSAAMQLARIPTEINNPKLLEWQNRQLEKLKTESPNERARKLGFVYQKQAVTLLTALLQDKNISTVQNAAESLGGIGAYHPEWLQTQFQTLITLTHHENINVQIAAVTALGNIISFQGTSKAEAFPDMDKSIREDLIKLATDDKQKRIIRLTAVDALGETKRADIAALLFPLLNDNNQKILHFSIYRLMARSEYQPAKEVLQQHLAILEQQKQEWRKQRDIDAQKVQAEDNLTTDKEDKSWQHDYIIYQIAYAIAKIDPQNAGMEMLNHSLYQAREAAIRALAEKANGELMQKLIKYHQDFDWEKLPSPRPYATYRAIDKALEQIEYTGTANDLKILQDLRAKMIIPAKSQNPSDKEQQQDAISQRFDWTIAELSYRLKQN